MLYLLINNIGGRGRRKAKVKFSFPCHSDKPDQSLVVSDSDEGTSSDKILIADEIGDVVDDEMHNNLADSQLNIHNKHILTFEMPHNHDTRGHSMAEILGGFLERSDLQEESSKLVRLSSMNFSPGSTVYIQLYMEFRRPRKEEESRLF